MNNDEADEVLMMMSQLWFKSAKMPEGTLKMWHTSLLGIDKAIATKCIDALVKAFPYWPAISEFKHVYDSLLRQEQMTIEPIEREYLPREENIRRLRELRESLKSQG